MPPWINPQYPEAETVTTTAKVTPIQVLPFPFGAYQDTYGILLGAAVALYDPQTQTRLTTSYLTNLNGYSRYKERFQWRRPNEWLLDVSASFGTDIQHYYGEGDNTPDVFQSYLSNLTFGIVSFQYSFKDNFYLGPSVEYFYRIWNPTTNDPVFANESEFRMGAQATWDYRDDILEPHHGSYFQLGLFTLPSVGENMFGADVWQLEGDARDYVTLFDHVVLALRANGAWTMAGQPSYSFEYSLGGTSELRGFNSNRFRGLDFYGLQGEIRFPIFPWLIGATSLDAGDITSTAFTNLPLMSWQIGLRSDVAEELGIIFRMDYGFGYSGSVFIYSINEPF
jgi:outer membrane protein assembly factor BamA